MNRHLKRILLFIMAIAGAFTWWLVRIWNQPSDDILLANFLSAATFIAAAFLVLAWGSYVDLRQQGLAPKGVYSSDDRGKPAILGEKRVLRSFRNVSADPRAVRDWVARQPIWLTQVIPHASALAVALLMQEGVRRLVPIEWRLWPYLIVSVWTMLALLLLLRRMLMMRTAFVCRQAAAFGACGSCGYSLRGLPSQGDGCTICPECGAAWRVEIPPPQAPHN